MQRRDELISALFTGISQSLSEVSSLRRPFLVIFPKGGSIACYFREIAVKYVYSEQLKLNGYDLRFIDASAFCVITPSDAAAVNY